MEPGRSRPPLPYLAALSIVLYLAKAGLGLKALAVWLMFETWARVGECLRLVKGSVIPPSHPELTCKRSRTLHGDSTTHTTVVLNISEE